MCVCVCDFDVQSTFFRTHSTFYMNIRVDHLLVGVGCSGACLLLMFIFFLSC